MADQKLLEWLLLQRCIATTN